jgi:uncharacterized protein YqjF (DUF2071 family)
MFQRWSDLLFLHWTWPSKELQAHLPPGLTIDTFEGEAYLGVVPFFMRGIRPRFCPAMPWLSNFQELNLRTYVHSDDGTPGVWFFSLDAANPIAVAIAKRFFHLPYRHARMHAERKRDITYHSKLPGHPAQQFRYPVPQSTHAAEPGSLDFFLLERYYLFSHDAHRDRLFRGQVAHPPYQFAPTTTPEIDLGPIATAGFRAPTSAPCHQAVSPGVHVRILPLTRLR